MAADGIILYVTTQVQDPASEHATHLAAIMCASSICKLAITLYAIRIVRKLRVTLVFTMITYAVAVGWDYGLFLHAVLNVGLNTLLLGVFTI